MRMAASKTITIKGVSWSCNTWGATPSPSPKSLTYQRFAIRAAPRERTEQGHLMTQISCTFCTGTPKERVVVGSNCTPLRLRQKKRRWAEPAATLRTFFGFEVLLQERQH